MTDDLMGGFTDADEAVLSDSPDPFQARPPSRTDLARTAYRAAFPVLRNHEDSIDTAGDTMVELLSRIDRIQDPRRWVYRTARNKAINKLEQARRLREAVEGLGILTQAGCLDSELPDPPPEVLRALVALLPARQQEAITLFYLDNLNRPQVAQRMGLSLNTVKTHLQRGVQNLQAYFDEAGPVGYQEQP